MARKDPLRNFRFRVEIDGIAVAGFSEVIIGPTTTEAIDYREGTDPPHGANFPGSPSSATSRSAAALPIRSTCPTGTSRLSRANWRRTAGRSSS